MPPIPKWKPRGKRRIHSKPSARQIAACKPWLTAEIQVMVTIHPSAILRMPDRDARQRAREQFTEDLRAAALRLR